MRGRNAGAECRRAEEIDDPAEVLRAFATVRQWVTFETPRIDDLPYRSTAPPASCVVLRRSGRVLGVGTGSAADSRPPHTSDWARTMCSATRLRLSSRLRQREVSDPDAAYRRCTANGTGKSILIELEIAGRLIPVISGSIEQPHGSLTD
jgi:hypothetical protein